MLLMDEFAKANCEVIFLSHHGLPDNPETNLLLQVQGVIAEYERSKILERTRRGRRYAASIGKLSVFSGAPYGYRYITKEQGGGQASWEINPVESEHVRLMFHLVGEQQQSLSVVCRELNQREIRTQRGNAKWCSSTIRGILRNPAYYGNAIYGKVQLSERKPGKRRRRGDPAVPSRSKVAVATEADKQISIPVPAIISRGLYDQVGKQMDANLKRKREHLGGPKYLLSGLLVCGHCGCAYCGQRQRDGKHSYYRCIGREKRRMGGQACPNSNVRGEALESLVWNEVCEVLREPERLALELERRQGEQTTSSQEEQIKVTQKRVEELSLRIERLIDAYTEGLLDPTQFKSRIERLRRQHDQEASALASQRGEYQTGTVNEAIKSLEHLASRVELGLETADPTIRRELLNLLIDRVEIHRSNLRIVYKIPAIQPAGRETQKKSRQHCSRRRDESPTKIFSVGDDFGSENRPLFPCSEKQLEIKRCAVAPQSSGADWQLCKPR